ncbi:unnamed protein product [Blepharisma stoltei]|uniref:AAA-ATPase-like domain-containing protein n=1 Tax=Blepharisma stoltei TaxID=1481888 RepID=A0AAU9JKH0_9CILI|nr:unnamed protein product [Blepharisma stoltei]
MESLEKPLYEVFKRFQSSDYLSSTECCLSAYDIKRVLKSIYKGRVHIKSIDAIFNYSPASSDEINGILICLTQLEKIVRRDCEELKKPIVSFWNINDKNQPGEQAKENYIWQSMVIIPKNYTSLDGEPLSNSSELIYMVDSSGNNYNLPALVKFLLKTQISYKNSNGDLYTIGGLFPLAIINDSLSIKQSRNTSQSWLWLIFNAIMLTSTGNCNYLNEFSYFDANWSNKILAIFEDLGINLTEEENIESLRNNFSSELLKMIEKAILNELIAKLSLWPILEGGEGFLAKKLNISQLCVLSMYQDNNKLDDALQFLDSFKEKGESDSDLLNTPTELPSTYQSLIKVKKNCKINSTIQSFKRAVDEDTIIVDKTMLIKAILDDNNTHIAITRPTGWGKSFNMSMLQAFLNPQINWHEQFLNLYLFTGKRNSTDKSDSDDRRRKNIMIADKEKYTMFAGKIPTILFVFPKIWTSNAEIYYEEIKIALSKTLREHVLSYHQYLEQKLRDSSIYTNFRDLTTEGLEKIIDKNKIDLPEEVKLFRLYLSNRSKINIYKVLQDLAIMLNMIHNQSVILIIDDYDCNIRNAGTDIEQRHNMIDLLRIMLGSLVCGQHYYIRKIIVTGVYYYPLIEIFPSGHFISSTVLDNYLSDYFGFTEPEVDELIERHLAHKSLAHLIQQKQLIKQWYGG